MAVSHTLQSSPFIHMHTMIMGVLETEVDSGKAVGREEERERESGENHKEPIYGNKVALARSISECMCVCVCVCAHLPFRPVKCQSIIKKKIQSGPG